VEEFIVVACKIDEFEFMAEGNLLLAWFLLQYCLEEIQEAKSGRRFLQHNHYFSAQASQRKEE
jgi:hypothetical protein